LISGKHRFPGEGYDEPMADVRRAFAPGRVNLMGDHTDYTGGLALPMAIQLGTTVELRPGGDRLRLQSEQEPIAADVPITGADPATVQPPWARYVAAVVNEVRPELGGTGTVSSTLPIGAGLSSSASFELALALALGHHGGAMELALLGQRAEHAAVGVPCGLLDQLSSAYGQPDAALLVDFTSLEVSPVRIPPDVSVVVVDSRQPRTLAGSAYADRRRECEAAESFLGPLKDCSLEDVQRLEDPVLRRRARHVVAENQRVRDFAAALERRDLRAAGELMRASHASLRDDFEVSVAAVDALVERLAGTPGVHGARMTGGGFGGCVVALTEPLALSEGWEVRPSAAARLI
jgi:galactokinase